MLAEPLSFVYAADDSFAMPLAAAIRSLAKNLGVHSVGQVFILDGGVSYENRSRLAKSLCDVRERLTLVWVPVDASLFRSIKDFGHVSSATFFRTLIGRLLPDSVSRILYLDCDTLVRSDVSSLFELPLHGRICAAVQDIAAPYFDAREALATRPLFFSFCSATKPVPNYRELGLRPSGKYFNAGVLLIDMTQWRQRSIESRLLECISANRERLIWWDQFALNVVLCDDWMPLDPSWNQTSHIYRLPSYEASHLDAESFNTVLTKPRIIHFSSSIKPWHARCRHPLRTEFFRCLDDTEWRDWRPSIKDWCRETLCAFCRDTRGVVGARIDQLFGRLELPAHLR